MNILAIDTSMGACSAAVFRGKIFRRYELRERGHAEALFPMIEAVMAEARLIWRELDRVAAVIGPGSFTGVRVGVAAARGLALALGCPAVGAVSLTVMAQKVARDLGEEGITAGFAIAAATGREELYFQLFGLDGGPLSQPAVLSPARAAALLPEGVRIAAGSGGKQLAQTAAAAGRPLQAILPGLQPDAADLAILAAKLEPAAAPLIPLYLRPPGAKPQTGKGLLRLG